MKINGFSLIECMVSIIVLSVLLIGGIALYSLSHQSLSFATQEKFAAEAASSALEQIKHNGYSALPDPAPSSPGLWQGPIAVQVGHLTGQMRIYVFDINPNLKQVRVEISWLAPNKPYPDSVTCDTYMAN